MGSRRRGNQLPVWEMPSQRGLRVLAAGGVAATSTLAAKLPAEVLE